MNRNFIPICLFVVISIPFYSCNKCCGVATPQGNWVELSKESNSVSPSGAVCFVIGSNAFISFANDSAGNYQNETWMFTPSSQNGGAWFQVSGFPGSVRNFAVAFSASNKGYIGSGYNGTNALSDFWQYDPSINTWTRISDFPGNARYGAIAFGIGNYGYFMTGTDGTNYFNDLWKYDPTGNSWLSLGDYPGIAKSGAITFVYNNRGYIVTGIGAGGKLDNAFYSFDPSQQGSAAWTSLRPVSNVSPETYDDGYTSIVRSNGVGFVMLNTNSNGEGDRAYITTGIGEGSFNNTTWEYDFADSLWTKKTSYERAPRVEAIGFSVQNLGFVGLGSNGTTTFYSNIDEWFPDEPYNSKD